MTLQCRPASRARGTPMPHRTPRETTQCGPDHGPWGEEPSRCVGAERTARSGTIALRNASGAGGPATSRENTIRGKSRPTVVLTCYFKRKRIGAYLDGALGTGQARSIEAHLAQCGGCQAEAETLRRMKAILSRFTTVADPNWTGFWEGVAGGIERGKSSPASVIKLPPERVPWRPRLALAGAMVAGLLAFTLWQALEPPAVVEPGSFVQTAHTEYPDGNVMVYSPAEANMTVIWVFGPGQTGSEAL
jgi:Putative zinc-finger